MTRAKIGATRPHGKKARGADCKKLETETSFFAFFMGLSELEKNRADGWRNDEAGLEFFYNRPNSLTIVVESFYVE